MSAAGEVPADGNLPDRIPDLNVLGQPLEPCSFDPLTGYYRDGCCSTGLSDTGTHVVCAEMTETFLRFSKLAGNDLSTPVPSIGFPGLRPGDRWCVCATRWVEAYRAGVAPRLYLASTHSRVLDFITLDELLHFAIDHPG